MSQAFWTTAVIVHVTSGVLALLVGLVAMRAKKGRQAHRRAGLLFVGTMTVVCISAFLLLVRRPNVFLLVITILSFYQVFTGWRVLRRKRPLAGEGPTVVDWGVAVIALAAGMGFIAWGGLHLAGRLEGSYPTAFYGLGIFFGSAIAYDGYSDLRAFRAPRPVTGWWLLYHISRMGGAYIAMTTAFTVFQLSPHLPMAWQWVPWVAPAAIGTTVIRRTVARYQTRFAASNQARARRGSAIGQAAAAAGD